MKWQPPSLSLVWLGTVLFVVLELACLWMFHYKWLDRETIQGIYQSADYARPNYDALKSKPEITQMRGDIHSILGLFEEIAIAIFQRSVSEEKLKRFFGAVIPMGYDGLQGFILAERKEDKRHDYFREAQRLVERWTGTKRPEMLP